MKNKRLFRIYKGVVSGEAAFIKYTTHAFRGFIEAGSPETLAEFAVTASNKKNEFWQRDSFAVH